MSTSATIDTPRVAVGSTNLIHVFFCAALCVLAAELIGAISVPLGGTYKVVLLPLLWALLIGAAWGLAKPVLPEPLKLEEGLQAISAAVLQPALLLFVGKLGLLVGGSLPKILSSGWALVFQGVRAFLRHNGVRIANRTSSRHQA